MKIDTTKRGFPAMWERGGGMTSGGSAQVITGRNGEARRPIYLPRGGHLACGDHALIGVDKGFLVVTASVRRGERESANISRIVSTSVKDIDGVKFEATAEVEVLNTFSRGEWSKELDPRHAPAVEAAFRKAGDYHCRSAYYVDDSKKPEPTGPELAHKAAQMRAEDERRAKLRQAKADADALAKAEAEATSKTAKEAGLGSRLEAANLRLAALDHEVVELGEVSFKWSWQTQLYSEENVTRVERHVEEAERKAAELETQRLAREAFQPRFEAMKPRTEALTLQLEVFDEFVRLSGDYVGYPYSEDGLANLMAKLSEKESAIAEAKLKAESEAKQATLEAEAVAAGLPENMTAWRRRGGATNAGDGFVVRPNGALREHDSIDCPRWRYSDEGTLTWRQICAGELMLRWSKAYTAAPHEFEVVYRPAAITPEQLRTVQLIEEELAGQWDDRRGVSGVSTSPAVGKGWNLTPPPAPKAERQSTTGGLDLSALASKFAVRPKK